MTARAVGLGLFLVDLSPDRSRRPPTALAAGVRWCDPVRGASADQADVIHALCEKIVVAGRTFVNARITPAAYRHGLAVALPEMAAMARPTGFGRSGTHPGFRHIPVEGAEDWEAACLRSA